MAQYFTDDFADFSTCSGVDCGDWTRRLNTAGTFSVASGDLTIGGSPGTDWYALTWDDLDGDADRDDVEILTLITFTGAYAPAIIVRGSGADESASHYVFRLNTTTVGIAYCAGSDAPTTVATASVTHTVGVDYWVRMRIIGTSLKVKSWAGAVGDEPGTWAVDTTDSNVTGVGWIGVAKYNIASSVVIKQLGVGTNGDTAPSSGTSSQTLTPSLFTNTQTFHAATISRGAVALAPSLITNTQTFYAATVSQGGITLQPNLVTNTQTFFGSTVSVGNVTLSPSLLTNGQTFYAPTVSQGEVLRPSLYTNEQIFYAPAITTGAIDLTPSLFTNTQTFFAPTVANVGGSQTLTPDLFTNEQTFYSATVSALTLTQADLDAIAAAVWADATAVAAHAKLDAIIARLTC